MNRAQRRGLRQRLGLHKPRARADLLAALAGERAEREALEARLAALEARQPIPGSEPGRKAYTVIVGGQPVEIVPLSGQEWASAIEELPGFLFAYAVAQASGKALGGDELEDIRGKAQRWIQASLAAGQEVRLERLSVPEAGEAIKVISTLNGFDAHLAAWFRGRSAGAQAPHDGAAVRGEAQHAPEGPN